MSDPLALLPFALAAGGGRLNGIGSASLVAAGVTLLQRAAPLVRALSGRQSCILLPLGPAFLTALAASDGHEALVIDPNATHREIGAQLARHDVGAVFTVDASASAVPPNMPCVLLDELPARARLRLDGVYRTVDLGTHRGLRLEGSRDVEGRADVCLVSSDLDGRLTGVHTHRRLLNEMRVVTSRFAIGAADVLTIALPCGEWPCGLIVTGATLRAGGSAHVCAIPLDAGARETTIVVADTAALGAWVDAIAASPLSLAPPALRHVLVVGPQPAPRLRAHFEHYLRCVVAPWTGGAP